MDFGKPTVVPSAFEIGGGVCIGSKTACNPTSGTNGDDFIRGRLYGGVDINYPDNNYIAAYLGK